MTLIPCPICKNECSPNASICPKCGQPLLSGETDFKLLDEPTSENKKWKFLTLSLGLVLLLGIASFAAYKLLTSPAIEQTKISQKATDEALEALRKVDAATEVGINKLDYSTLLINAQAVSNHANEVLPEGSVKNGIKATMTSYMDAKTIWFLMGDDDSIWTCAEQPDKTGQAPDMQRFLDLSCNPESGAIAKKYRIPIRSGPTFQITDKGRIIKKEALSIIWQAAKEQLRKTTEEAKTQR